MNQTNPLYNLSTKFTWEQVKEAFHAAGFTDCEHGLLDYGTTPTNTDIGVEEYACGDKIRKALQTLGIQIID